jgi:hypothetical protein
MVLSHKKLDFKIDKVIKMRKKQICLQKFAKLASDLLHGENGRKYGMR